MIYVIKAKNSTPEMVKIGYAARSIEQRIKTIQTSCPFELELIFAKNGGFKEEAILHKRLAKHKYRGEWFLWNEEVMAEFKLQKETKAKNPRSPESFLTPRQKQLNNLFRRSITNENFLYVQTLSLFLAGHCYTERDISEFPAGKARFRVFKSTHEEVMKLYGTVQSAIAEDKEGEKLFIGPINPPKWEF